MAQEITGANNVYSHSLKIELRKGCTGWLCFQQVVKTKTSTDSRYNMVQTVNGFTPCKNKNDWRYDMVAYPTVRSVQFGPFVDIKNYVVNCEV